MYLPPSLNGYLPGIIPSQTAMLAGGFPQPFHVAHRR